MTPDRKRLVFRYGVAIDLIVIATGLALLAPTPSVLLVIFFIAIALVAWMAGWEAGLASTGLSAIGLMTAVGPGELSLDEVMLFSAAGVLVSAAAILIRPRIAAALEDATRGAPASSPAAQARRDQRVERLAQSIGFPLLIAFVYANFSDILIRNFHIPSLLQPIIAALAIPIAIRRDYFRPSRSFFMPLSMILAAWCVLLFTSSTWARDTSLADQRLTEFVKAFLIYLLVAILPMSWSALRRGIAAMVIASAFIASLTIAQFATDNRVGDFGGLARLEEANIYEEVSEMRYTGPLGDPNFYAQVLLMVVPFAITLGITERQRVLVRAMWFGCAVLIAGGILLSYSRGGLLALGAVAAMLFYTIRIPRSYKVAVAVAAVVALLIVLPTDVGRRLLTVKELLLPRADVTKLESSAEKRKLVMRSALGMFDDHLIGGVGAANFTPYYNEYSNRVGTTVTEYDREFSPQFPHSLYIETAAETGLIGLTVLAAMIVATFAMLLRARRQLLDAGQTEAVQIVEAIAIAVAGYLITSVFLHSAFARYLWMLLGMATAAARLSLAPQSGERVRVRGVATSEALA